MYRALFTCAGAPWVSASAAGGNFTRFMLAGFVSFRAWREMGVPALEAYPDLQFRLNSRGALPPKRARGKALSARARIIGRLRRSFGLSGAAGPRTLDQADAEVLALTAAIAARTGSLAALEHPAEGRFLLTLRAMIR